MGEHCQSGVTEGAATCLSRFACVACLTALVTLGACGGSDDPVLLEPSRPPDVTVPDPPTRPTFQSLVLHGRITESAPTTITEIYPATVTIIDGEYAGIYADVDASGFYEIPDLRPGAFTLTAAADGFVSASRRIDFGVQRTVNFGLLPVFRTLHYEMTGDIAGTDGTCYDGEADRPCRIVTFPVHNDGTIEGRLDWTPSHTSDLDLALFRTGNHEPITRSAIRGRDNDVVRADVAGGVTYELRITYAAGTTPAAYTLTFDCPN